MVVYPNLAELWQQIFPKIVENPWKISAKSSPAGIKPWRSHLFSSRVDGNPLGDVKGISVHDDPGVFLARHIRVMIPPNLSK